MMTVNKKYDQNPGPETIPLDEKVPSWKRTVIATIAIVGIAVALLLFIFNTEPIASRGGAVRKSAMLVEVVVPEAGRFRPRITVTGVVEASQDIVLRPQVGGKVVSVATGFVPGGFVPSNSTLLQIERADFSNVVEQRESELTSALSDLDLELGRSRAAAADYELLDKELAPDAKALSLREPQLAAMRQRVKAARAAVSQAKLDLTRTNIKLPFDVQVLSREVNVGSQVATTSTLGRIVGVDRYWVTASVPLSKLNWLVIPETGEKGSLVQVRNLSAWPKGAYREGHVTQLIGALDSGSRMARIIATIEDPLARNSPENTPKLIIGEYLEVDILGRELPEGVRLHRDYLRAGDTVWVMDKEGKLQIREVKIAVRDNEFAYISTGLEAGEQVVITDLATIREGAALRLKSQETSHE